MGIDDEATLRNIRVYCASSRFFRVPAISGSLLLPRGAGRVHVLMVNSRVGLRCILGYCLIWLRHVRLLS